MIALNNYSNSSLDLLNLGVAGLKHKRFLPSRRSWRQF